MTASDIPAGVMPPNGMGISGVRSHTGAFPRFSSTAYTTNAARQGHEEVRFHPRVGRLMTEAAFLACTGRWGLHRSLGLHSVDSDYFAIVIDRE